MLRVMNTAEDDKRLAAAKLVLRALAADKRAASSRTRKALTSQPANEKRR
jgi:hypothetical protein